MSAPIAERWRAYSFTRVTRGYVLKVAFQGNQWSWWIHRVTGASRYGTTHGPSIAAGSCPDEKAAKLAARRAMEWEVRQGRAAGGRA